MREQAEVLAEVDRLVRGDDRIRGALLSGSRVNPTHKPDLLSDYDILLTVTDVASFAADEEWLGHFGEVLLMQRPHSKAGRRAWLVVYHDGLRIDFTLSRLEAATVDAEADSLTVVLADKDHLYPALPDPDERSHMPSRPSSEQFGATCNEFWWVLVYAAKGLWRRQLPYAKYNFDVVVRAELETLLGWYAASLHDWAINLGAAHKYLDAYLPHGLWSEYLQTFAGSDAEANWQALSAAAHLADFVGSELADQLGYLYDREEAANALRLVNAIRNLGSDTTTFESDEAVDR
jgi:aminoglycoside 6-adenylyltransferase